MTTGKRRAAVAAAAFFAFSAALWAGEAGAVTVEPTRFVPCSTGMCPVFDEGEDDISRGYPNPHDIVIDPNLFDDNAFILITGFLGEHDADAFRINLEEDQTLAIYDLRIDDLQRRVDLIVSSEDGDEPNSVPGGAGKISGGFCNNCFSRFSGIEPETGLPYVPLHVNLEGGFDDEIFIRHSSFDSGTPGHYSFKLALNPPTPSSSATPPSRTLPCVTGECPVFDEGEDDISRGYPNPHDIVIDPNLFDDNAFILITGFLGEHDADAFRINLVADQTLAIYDLRIDDPQRDVDLLVDAQDGDDPNSVPGGAGKVNGGFCHNCFSLFFGIDPETGLPYVPLHVDLDVGFDEIFIRHDSLDSGTPGHYSFKLALNPPTLPQGASRAAPCAPSDWCPVYEEGETDIGGLPDPADSPPDGHFTVDLDEALAGNPEFVQFIGFLGDGDEDSYRFDLTKDYDIAIFYLQLSDPTGSALVDLKVDTEMGADPVKPPDSPAAESDGDCMNCFSVYAGLDPETALPYLPVHVEFKMLQGAHYVTLTHTGGGEPGAYAFRISTRLPTLGRFTANPPGTIPLPPSVWALGAALGLFGLWRRRRSGRGREARA